MQEWNDGLDCCRFSVRHSASRHVGDEPMTEHLPAPNSRVIDALNERIAAQNDELARLRGDLIAERAEHKRAMSLVVTENAALKRNIEAKNARIEAMRAATANEEREG